MYIIKTYLPQCVYNISKQALMNFMLLPCGGCCYPQYSLPQKESFRTRFHSVQHPAEHLFEHFWLHAGGVNHTINTSRCWYIYIYIYMYIYAYFISKCPEFQIVPRCIVCMKNFVEILCKVFHNICMWHLGFLNIFNYCGICCSHYNSLIK